MWTCDIPNDRKFKKKKFGVWFVIVRWVLAKLYIIQWKKSEYSQDKVRQIEGFAMSGSQALKGNDQSIMAD